MAKGFWAFLVSILTFSCSGGTPQAATDSGKQNTIKDSIIISIKLPAYKGVLLNYTNHLYANQQLLFKNNTDYAIVKSKSLAKNTQSIINFFAVYMGNIKKPIDFHHSFFLNNADTIFLECTDSSDIRIAARNSHEILFADSLENAYAILINAQRLSDKKSIEKFIAALQKNDSLNAVRIANSNYSSLTKKQLRDFSTLCYYNTALSISQKFNLGTESKETLQTIISEVATWLKKRDPYPNSLSGIFEHIYNLTDNAANNCRLSAFVNAYPDLLSTKPAQGFVFQKLIADNKKSSPCWTEVLNLFKRTHFYQQEKGTIDTLIDGISMEKRGPLVKNFMLKNEAGQVYHLGSVLEQRKEKYFLLDFWATWCAPCKEQMRHLHDIAKKLPADIALVNISLDNAPDFAKWRIAIKGAEYGHGVNYFAVDGFNSKFCEHFLLKTIPRYILINKSGEVINDDFIYPTDTHFITELSSYK